MMWSQENKNKVKRLVEKYISDLRSYGFDIRELEEIKFTHAMRVNGWCITHRDNYKFTLGISCYRVADGWNAVKETILHELCHAIASHGAGHGKEWQDIAKAVGDIYDVNIERCQPHSIKVKEESKRYIVKCDKCGASWNYMRKTKFVKAVMENHANTWRCGCGSHHFSIVKGEN